MLLRSSCSVGVSSVLIALEYSQKLLLHSHTHQVWENYIASFCTTAILRAVVVWLTTHLKRRESAVLTLMNAEKTSRERDERSDISFKRCGCTVRARWRRAQWHHKELREVSASAIVLSLRLRCDKLRSMSASTELLWCVLLKTFALSRRPHSVSTACLSKCRATARNLCTFKVRAGAGAWRSVMF